MEKSGALILKQRSSRFDAFLLRVVFPYLHRSRLRQVVQLAYVWHKVI